RISRQLSRELEPARAIGGVVDVRIKGAIGVVELARIGDLNGLKRAFVEAGVWVRPFRNIVYLTPAFTIGENDLAALTEAVIRVLRSRDFTRESPKGNR